MATPHDHARLKPFQHAPKSLSAVEEERFHGLPPLKRFKILEKERQELLLLPQLQEKRDSESTVCCLPAKKRVCALQIFSVADEKENAAACVARGVEKKEGAPRVLQPLTNHQAAGKLKGANAKDLSVTKKEKKRSSEKASVPCEVPTMKFPEMVVQNHQMAGKRKGVKDFSMTEKVKKHSVCCEVPTMKSAEMPTKAREEEEEEQEGEDGILCNVCKESDADESDPIVFCDGCNVMVHASCYGQPLIDEIPAGDWFCAQCDEKVKKRGCCLCPSKEGAMKKTTGGQWAHLSCALFVPEVYYRRAREKEGIECRMVPAWRWQMTCILCGREGEGACIQCTEVGCTATFHVSCGLDRGLPIDYRFANALTKTPAIIIAFCPLHSPRWQQMLSHTDKPRFRIVPRD